MIFRVDTTPIALPAGSRSATSDKRVEYTAMGSVVNRAFRYGREAAPGEILIGDRTHSEVHEDVSVKTAVRESGTAEKTHVVVGLKYLS